MTNCLDAGVRTLEHGNFISSEVAERMARSGTFLVPTIATYELLAADGRSLGYPEYVIQKIEQALKGAYEALSIARQAGVKIGSGSDVLGAQQRKKAFELGYKGKVMSPMEVLIATTMTNAEIVWCAERPRQHRDRKVGRSAVGRWQSTGRPVGPRGPRAHPHGDLGRNNCHRPSSVNDATSYGKGPFLTR